MIEGGANKNNGGFYVFYLASIKLTKTGALITLIILHSKKKKPKTVLVFSLLTESDVSCGPASQTLLLPPLIHLSSRVLLSVP